VWTVTVTRLPLLPTSLKPLIMSCFVRLFGSPTLVGCLKVYLWVSFFLSLPEHRFQQPRQGRPANAYQRFGHRCSYYHWPTDLPYPYPNFYTGSKSAIFGLITQQRSNFEPLWFGNRAIYLHHFSTLCVAMTTKFGAERSTRFQITPGSIGVPPKTDEKSVVNRQ